jgi:phosphoglycolate phosphatase
MRVLIFDFDGTIVDSKAVYYKAMNTYLNPLGFSKNDVDKAIDLGLSVSETLKKMIPSRIYAWWLKRKIMKAVLRDIKKVRKCKDVSAIKDLKAKKILISNSSSEFVLPILKHLRLKKYFKEIYGAEFFDNKEEFIKAYLKKNRIKAEDCYYVGDRVADVLVARKVKCRSIVISGKCSWDSRQEILKVGPDFIVEDLADIKKIISS